MPNTQAVAQRSMHAEPNVTPFLDVLLVLLIIFMFVSLNEQKAMIAQLPDPAVNTSPDTSVPIVLLVQPDGAYTINGEHVAASRLGARLREIYDHRPTKTIMVRAAKGVRYQEVITAMDVAKEAGIVAVGL